MGGGGSKKDKDMKRRRYHGVFQDKQSQNKDTQRLRTQAGRRRTYMHGNTDCVFVFVSRV